VVFDLAEQAGFARCGIAAVDVVHRADYLDEWLQLGRAGEMDYLARHRELRRDPRQLLPGAQSIIVVADLYRQPDDQQLPKNCHSQNGVNVPTGRVARYAWGRDYHRVLRKKRHRLTDRLREAINEPFEARTCVDTAPVLEREWAAAAGIGWIGKNTMVLNEQIGSFFFLGEIIMSLELTASTPAVDHCGTCSRCLQACPTGALVAPYQMDASRCISYLTIEHRGHIDPALQPLMSDWVYGCDICQEVCPHNRRVPAATADPAYAASDRNPLVPRVPLPVLKNLTPEDYDRYLAGSAMKRATLSMLQRNAVIASSSSNSSSPSTNITQS